MHELIAMILYDEWLARKNRREDFVFDPTEVTIDAITRALKLNLEERDAQNWSPGC